MAHSLCALSSRRLPFAAMLLASCAGCGRQFDKAVAQPTASNEAQSPLVVQIEPKSRDLLPLNAKSWDGVLRGRVVYLGRKERRRWTLENRYGNLPNCAKKPELEKFLDPFWIGQDNGLAEVAVYLQQPKYRHYLPTRKELQVRKDHVVIEIDCDVYPRIALHVPAYRKGNDIAPTGQKLWMVYADDYIHNFHFNTSPDKTLAEAGIPGIRVREVDLPARNRPFPGSCSVHPWMRNDVIALDHPFAAITDSAGRFQISDLPTDVDVRLVLFHPWLGYIGRDGKEGIQMRFRPGPNEMEWVLGDEGVLLK